MSLIVLKGCIRKVTDECSSNIIMAVTNVVPRSKHVDSGYSWVILCASTGVSFFHLGLLKVYGVFVPELVEQLSMSVTAVGLCCSIGLGLRAILGVFSLTLIIEYYFKILCHDKNEMVILNMLPI